MVDPCTRLGKHATSASNRPCACTIDLGVVDVAIGVGSSVGIGGVDVRAITKTTSGVDLRVDLRRKVGETKDVGAVPFVVSAEEATVFLTLTHGHGVSIVESSTYCRSIQRRGRGGLDGKHTKQSLADFLFCLDHGSMQLCLGWI